MITNCCLTITHFVGSPLNDGLCVHEIPALDSVLNGQSAGLPDDSLEMGSELTTLPKSLYSTDSLTPCRETAELVPLKGLLIFRLFDTLE